MAEETIRGKAPWEEARVGEVQQVGCPSAEKTHPGQSKRQEEAPDTIQPEE